ncbi:NAD(P)-binding protein [Acephala macrosclerotiorum]|nr:NAD(P)-binding protein [Acephala macrosclerotiorum]
MYPQAVATSFAKANPKGIVLVARTAELLEALSKEIRAINPQHRALWEEVKAKFDHADVLVNNAGTFTDSAPVKAAEAAKWWYDFEVNGRGTFLATEGFLNLLGEKKGTIINLTTGAAHSISPGLSAYPMSKLLSLQLGAYVAAENPNVTAISLHPGVLPTDMTIESFKRFALATPELVGGVSVWLATDKAAFLTGRYVNANWSVDELAERNDEIVGDNKLTIALTEKFGIE